MKTIVLSIVLLLGVCSTSATPSPETSSSQSPFVIGADNKEQVDSDLKRAIVDGLPRYTTWQCAEGQDMACSGVQVNSKFSGECRCSGSAMKAAKKAACEAAHGDRWVEADAWDNDMGTCKELSCTPPADVPPAAGMVQLPVSKDWIDATEQKADDPNSLGTDCTKLNVGAWRAVMQKCTDRGLALCSRSQYVEAYTEENGLKQVQGFETIPSTKKFYYTSTRCTTAPKSWVDKKIRPGHLLMHNHQGQLWNTVGSEGCHVDAGCWANRYYRCCSSPSVPQCPLDQHRETSDGPCVDDIPLSGGNEDMSVKPGTLKACTGECDSDDDCEDGLKCFQREHGEKIPGCKGEWPTTGTRDHLVWDFCYKPGNYWTFEEDDDIQVSGDNPSNPPAAAGSLQACTGECDTDAQCASGKCFQREHMWDEKIPGCKGRNDQETGDPWDYCIDPSKEEGAYRRWMDIRDYAYVQNP